MKRYTLFILLFLITFVSCDDGDIIVTSFDFEDQNLQYCEGASSLVFFKINTASQETIALNIVQDPVFLETTAITSIQLNTSNFVTYRSFNDAITPSYFCSSIPPTSPIVTVEFLAEAGVAELDVISSFDDNDNVPTEFEIATTLETELAGIAGFDINTDFDDIDGDGLSNLFDLDDDGDNVPTSLELNNDDDDDNPFTNPLDTDGDGIPNFLDDDDDGDGVLTRNESADGDLNPSNDITNAEIGADYLNPEVVNEIIINEYRQHLYNISSNVSIVLENITLVNGSETNVQEILNLGDIVDVVSRTITITPSFE